MSDEHTLHAELQLAVAAICNLQVQMWDRTLTSLKIVLTPYLSTNILKNLEKIIQQIHSLSIAFSFNRSPVDEG